MAKRTASRTACGQIRQNAAPPPSVNLQHTLHGRMLNAESNPQPWREAAAMAAEQQQHVSDVTRDNGSLSVHAAQIKTDSRVQANAIDQVLPLWNIGDVHVYRACKGTA